MSREDCRHLDDKGICRGKYDGFGCIDDKCQDPTRGPRGDKCRFLRDDGYCTKYKKFQCTAPDCEDYNV